MPSQVEAMIDGLLARALPHEIESARADFEARCGAFSTEDAFHEERIRAFSDELVCGRLPGAMPRPGIGVDTPGLAARLLDSTPDASSELRMWLVALTQSERSLFRVEPREEPRDEHLLLRCLLGGAVLRVLVEPRDPSSRLRSGDVFDGRVAPWHGAIRVLPGMIFHREEAHEALFAMLPALHASALSRGEILDGLARIRMRHDRFTSIHARHLYRLDAVEMREIQAASWKSPQR